MKVPTSLVFTVFAMATFAGSAYGSVYINNFQSGFDLGDMTTGTNALQGWVIDDATPDASYIVNAGLVYGSRSASLGYVGPLENDNVYLSHAATTPLVGAGTNLNASFSTLFTILDSDGGISAARDTFGFRLESSGANLFSFILRPTSQVPDPQDQTAYHELSWSTGIGAPTVVLAPMKVQETFNYTFTVNFFDAGGGVAGFNAIIGGLPFSGTLGAGSASQTIDTFGAFWNPLNGAADPGSNLLIFDNVNLIPEPSSVLLGLLGASFSFVRRRRA